MNWLWTLAQQHPRRTFPAQPLHLLVYRRVKVPGATGDGSLIKPPPSLAKLPQSAYREGERVYQLTSFQLTSFQLTGGEGDPVHISLRRRQQALFEWRRSRRSKRVSCRSWRSQASHRTRSHDPEVWARLLIDLIGPSSKWPQRIRLAWFAGDQPGKHSQWLIT